MRMCSVYNLWKKFLASYLGIHATLPEPKEINLSSPPTHVSEKIGDENSGSKAVKNLNRRMMPSNKD